MQFFSIAARELRVAARKRGTFRLRVLTSAVALFICGFSLWVVTLFGESPIPGEKLFFVLSWLAFIYACVVGVTVTADCVNEERNSGTLGLLFLTNLPGIAISLGKLTGQGLLALYALVSIVPVMALPLLLGGADPESLARTALVLLVTLILSLIIGMFASTLCRKTWVAAALALSIVALFVIGIPLAIFLLRLNHQPALCPWLELLTPSYSLRMAGPSAAMLPSNRLWPALGVQLLLALSFFGWVTFRLPRVWKEGTSGKKAHFISSTWRMLKYGSGEPRRSLRTRLLQINPILWLSSRERFGPMSPTLALLMMALAISYVGKHANLSAPSEFFSQMIAWIVGIPLLYIFFCLLLAADASERFAADRKAGALELIVCTPLKTREIIRGRWLGLVRTFWGGALLLLGLHAFALNYILEAIRIDSNESGLHRFGLRELIVHPVRHLFGTPVIPNDVAPLYIGPLAVLTAAILIVILWIALGWLGMALSLRFKRQILAPLVSLLLLALPPVPLFVCAVALLGGDKQLFASNLFLALLRVGASGFFIVLANALFWMFLARRWTYRGLEGLDA